MCGWPQRGPSIARERAGSASSSAPTCSREDAPTSRSSSNGLARDLLPSAGATGDRACVLDIKGKARRQTGLRAAGRRAGAGAGVCLDRRGQAPGRASKRSRSASRRDSAPSSCGCTTTTRRDIRQVPRPRRPSAGGCGSRVTPNQGWRVTIVAERPAVDLWTAPGDSPTLLRGGRRRLDRGAARLWTAMTSSRAHCREPGADRRRRAPQCRPARARDDGRAPLLSRLSARRRLRGGDRPRPGADPAGAASTSSATRPTPGLTASARDQPPALRGQRLRRRSVRASSSRSRRRDDGRGSRLGILAEPFVHERGVLQTPAALPRLRGGIRACWAAPRPPLLGRLGPQAAGLVLHPHSPAIKSRRRSTAYAASRFRPSTG